MRSTALLVGMGLGLGDVSGFAATAGGLAGGSGRPSAAARASAAGSSVVTGGTKTPIKAVREAQSLREGENRLTDIASVANLEEFQRTITRPKQVVAVWFQASWCRKCKYIGTRLKRLDEHLPAYLTNNLVVVSIDVNKVAEVPQRQKIKDLPTIQFFVEGEVVGSYVATDRGEVFYDNMEKHLREALGEDVA